MSTLVSSLFPTLVTIATNMMKTPPSQSQEIPTMLHLVLKTYKTSVVINLSAHQQSAESLAPWGQLFFAVVNLNIPKDVVPEDEEERERSEWWATKKWAYATLGRLFHRFGNPSQLPSSMKKDYLEFANHKVVQDLLKLSDETDLDILNHSMEVMVEQFQTELLPVAAQLTSRLSYLRLARESTAMETALDSGSNSTGSGDLESIMADGDNDKTYAAMGVAKTIYTSASPPPPISPLPASPELQYTLSFALSPTSAE
ncbi:hypothetical protein D9757_013749 [Collybiopsis confluens]|uniref:Uncharacterized protein n=1 Tax=Collybiopsis confluens TaxID=2823264 RepID=A0A8H5CWV2_9AGAR|nr:hypothetical protein D9757_013749 [Collybiopsis confluens]